MHSNSYHSSKCCKLDITMFEKSTSSQCYIIYKAAQNYMHNSCTNNYALPVTSKIYIYQQLQNMQLTRISPRCFGPNFTSVTDVRLSTRFPRLTHRCSGFSAASNISAQTCTVVHRSPNMHKCLRTNR